MGSINIKEFWVEGICPRCKNEIGLGETHGIIESGDHVILWWEGNDFHVKSDKEHKVFVCAYVSSYKVEERC